MLRLGQHYPITALLSTKGEVILIPSLILPSISNRLAGGGGECWPPPFLKAFLCHCKKKKEGFCSGQDSMQRDTVQPPTPLLPITNFTHCSGRMKTSGRKERNEERNGSFRQRTLKHSAHGFNCKAMSEVSCSPTSRNHVAGSSRASFCTHEAEHDSPPPCIPNSGTVEQSKKPS